MVAEFEGWAGTQGRGGGALYSERTTNLFANKPTDALVIDVSRAPAEECLQTR